MVSLHSHLFPIVFLDQVKLREEVNYALMKTRMLQLLPSACDSILAIITVRLSFNCLHCNSSPSMHNCLLSVTKETEIVKSPQTELFSIVK